MKEIVFILIVLSPGKDGINVDTAAFKKKETCSVKLVETKMNLPKSQGTCIEATVR
jgi:hypothetical protein